MSGIGRRITNRVRRLVGRDTDPRGQLLKRMPTGAVCAEIGVWKGQFSQRIWNETSPSELHLIDPWLFQSEFPQRMYGGKVAKEQSDMDAIHDGVAAQFAGEAGVRLHRGKSVAVLSDFDDDYFDWIYIDGNHYYDYVMADLDICRAKVKPGGIIAGDDFDWGGDIGLPVEQAVRDFVREHDLEDRLEIIRSQFIVRL